MRCYSGGMETKTHNIASAAAWNAIDLAHTVRVAHPTLGPNFSVPFAPEAAKALVEAAQNGTPLPMAVRVDGTVVTVIAT